MTKNISPLNGLVLAGGKSKRMGKNKASIEWHGKEQQYYVADLLSSFCKQVFISCSAIEKNYNVKDYNFLPDAIPEMGPLGGILTAFEKDPETAWLVVACDLPLMDDTTLQYLIAHRNTNAIATTFMSPHDGLPEPLITIWEPACLQELLLFQSKGITCPRKVLINSNVTILNIPDPITLMNVNTPEEAANVERIIENQNKQN